VEDRGVARGVAPETDERREEVGGVARLELRAGDAVVIETPGGGGFGAPPDAPGTRV
jgi:5-oxoprolinase (ATP-hydrolysing)